MNKSTELIAIPSKGREFLFSRLHSTIKTIRHSKRRKILFVPIEDYEDYLSPAHNWGYEVEGVSPDEAHDIASTYDYIFQRYSHRYDKILIMDDDLRLVRCQKIKPSSVVLQPEEVDTFVDTLFAGLDEPNVVMTGIPHLKGIHRLHKDVYYNRKLIAVMACNTKAVKDFKWAWEGKSMFDLHMIIQLLIAGYRNKLYAGYAHNDVLNRFGDGGCAAYRTSKDHGNAADLLVKKFPKIVKPRIKFSNIRNCYERDVTLYLNRFFGEGSDIRTPYEI